MAHRRNYCTQGTAPVASPTKSLLGLASGTTIRPAIYDLILGSSATPADNAILWQLQRFTAAGTSTAYVPLPLDAGDPACTVVAGVLHTVEPTYTAAAFLFRCSLNQRATHRWISDPDAPLLLPASANNGCGLFGVHSSFTGAIDATVFHYE